MLIRDTGDSAAAAAYDGARMGAVDGARGMKEDFLYRIMLMANWYWSACFGRRLSCDQSLV